MTRQLRRAARTNGDTVPSTECLKTMIRRWENGSGVSERYRLHFSRAFGIQPGHYGATPAPATPGRATSEKTPAHRMTTDSAASPARPSTIVVFISACRCAERNCPSDREHQPAGS
jgi:hypothetical protein